MNPDRTPNHRFLFIGTCIALMAAAVYIIGTSFLTGQREAILTTPLAESASESRLVQEISGFALASQALTYLDTPENPASTRTLRTFYARRAYPGAPPVIPHTIADEQTFGGATCLICHADGGYVPKFKAYAPVAPHPEMTNCRQCHVVEKTSSLFKITDWKAFSPPELEGGVLLNSPPPIPHFLQMRENCLACHAGPGAVPEIRVSHPERINCRQCHAASQTSASWKRTKSDLPGQ